MINNSLVSVCVPGYNSSKYIIETMNSIVNQTYDNIEIIFIDDCSSDDTFQLVTEWAKFQKRPVHIFRNEQNYGLVKTCNILLTKVTGKYFQTLGADDIICEYKIARQVDLLEKASENVKLVYTDVSVIDKDSNLISKSYLSEHKYDTGKMPVGKVFRDLLEFNFIPALSVLIRTATVKDLGGYNENYRFEDYDLWLKIGLNYEIAFMPGITAKYRRHSDSLMHNPANKAAMLDSLLTCLQSYLGLDDKSDTLIKKQIIKLAPAIYRFKYSTGKYWIKKRLQYDKKFKSYIYYFLSLANSRIIWKAK